MLFDFLLQPRFSNTLHSDRTNVPQWLFSREGQNYIRITQVELSWDFWKYARTSQEDLCQSQLAMTSHAGCLKIK